MSDPRVPDPNYGVPDYIIAIRHDLALIKEALVMIKEISQLNTQRIQNLENTLLKPKE